MVVADSDVDVVADVNVVVVVDTVDVDVVDVAVAVAVVDDVVVVDDAAEELSCLGDAICTVTLVVLRELVATAVLAVDV